MVEPEETPPVKLTEAEMLAMSPRRLRAYVVSTSMSEEQMGLVGNIVLARTAQAQKHNTEVQQEVTLMKARASEKRAVLLANLTAA